MGNLNIAIATVPTAKLSIGKDIELIKTALLYGDKVRLLSMTSPLFLYMKIASEHLSKAGKEEVTRALLLQFDPTITTAWIGAIETLERKRRRTPDEIKWLHNSKGALKKATDEVFKVFANIAENSGANELLPAFNRDLIDIPSDVPLFGNISISNDESGKNDLVETFVSKIIDETLCGDSFPMYDSQISDIIRLSTVLTATNLSEDRQEQIKHIATVHSTLSGLPNFSKANVDDIVSIRDELSKYLSKFRAAMLKYSGEIKSLPWDKGFNNEVSLLFLKSIAPAVAEIRSIVEQNSFLRKLCTNIVNDKIVIVPVVTGLGSTIFEGLCAAILPMAQAIQLPSALVSSGIAEGAVVVKNIINTYNEYLQEKHRAEENALYFYYKAARTTERIR